ncbi:SDR family NAD(P)-dependent oxidoreductase [Nocardia sp. NPDC051030]|uniref:SDR family NAD(P)-dependent oxidoreductase n=1 Tax=Nocardia sp. NPDC051030 TaxID=3155162 RepID=UPI00342584CC
MKIAALNPNGLLRAPSYDVQGRAALVTGAGQGIGREVVRILSERGASIVAVDIDEAAAQEVATEFGDRVLAMGADVSDRAAMVRAVEAAVERFGRLDIVVANAAMMAGKATIRTMVAEDFDRVLAVNLTGVFNTVRPALRHVVDNGGHVVVVSSCAAFGPGPSNAAYFTSKAGVEAFGRTLGVELAAVGASAGVAYFGVVDTAMAHQALDADEFARGAAAMLPWPLDARATAQEAAKSIADGIARRAVRTYSPARWELLGLVRGVANVAIDRWFARDRRMHELIRGVECDPMDRAPRGLTR